ncbi:hypothetical protein FOA52_014016 [Chlamydomonas sp. UWO 241]|nr:hypothetical protein FOA52_014016 [Chlamydomonas sp. UWO 241]
MPDASGSKGASGSKHSPVEFPVFLKPARELFSTAPALAGCELSNEQFLGASGFRSGKSLTNQMSSKDISSPGYQQDQGELPGQGQLLDKDSPQYYKGLPPSFVHNLSSMHCDNDDDISLNAFDTDSEVDVQGVMCISTAPPTSRTAVVEPLQGTSGQLAPPSSTSPTIEAAMLRQGTPRRKRLFPSPRTLRAFMGQMVQQMDLAHFGDVANDTPMPSPSPSSSP